AGQAVQLDRKAERRPGGSGVQLLSSRAARRQGGSGAGRLGSRAARRRTARVQGDSAPGRLGDWAARLPGRPTAAGEAAGSRKRTGAGPRRGRR
ncbi:unnamed protein product, partial [Closterium sp. NIES-64]